MRYRSPRGPSAGKRYRNSGESHGEPGDLDSISADPSLSVNFHNFRGGSSAIAEDLSRTAAVLLSFGVIPGPRRIQSQRPCHSSRIQKLPALPSRAWPEPLGSRLGLGAPIKDRVFIAQGSGGEKSHPGRLG